MENNHNFNDSSITTETSNKNSIYEVNHNDRIENGENFIRIYNAESNRTNIYNIIPKTNQRLSEIPRYYPKYNSTSFCLKNTTEYSRRMKGELMEMKNLKKDNEDFNLHTFNFLNEENPYKTKYFENSPLTEERYIYPYQENMHLNYYLDEINNNHNVDNATRNNFSVKSSLLHLNEYYNNDNEIISENDLNKDNNAKVLNHHSQNNSYHTRINAPLLMGTINNNNTFIPSKTLSYTLPFNHSNEEKRNNENNMFFTYETVCYYKFNLVFNSYLFCLPILYKINTIYFLFLLSIMFSYLLILIKIQILFV